MAARTLRLFAAAAVAWGIATSAAAQSANSGPVHRGIIRDHTGTPMPGVVVTLEHPQQTAVRVVVTDLWGEYAVHRLERGTRYVVRVDHPGFRKARLQAAAGDHVNVQLKPRRSHQTAEAREAADVLR